MADRRGVAELTDCPSCGRTTRTVGAGACAECWQPKVAGGRAVLREPAPKTEPLLGIRFDAFEAVPGWGWTALAIGILSAVGILVSALIT